MKTFRFKTTVKIAAKLTPSEFVDYYQGATEAEAREVYNEDLHRYGLPIADVTTEVCEVNPETLKPIN